MSFTRLAVDERLERPQDPKLEATVGLAAAAIHGLGAFTVDHRLLSGLHRATPLGRAGPTNPMRGSADLGESILGDRSGIATSPRIFGGRSSTAAVLPDHA